MGKAAQTAAIGLTQADMHRFSSSGQSLVPSDPLFEKDDVLYARAPITRLMVPRDKGTLLLDDDAGEDGPAAARPSARPRNHVRKDVTLMFVNDNKVRASG